MYKAHLARTQAWFSSDGNTFNSNDDNGDDTDVLLGGRITDPVVIEGSRKPMRVYDRKVIEERLRRNPVEPYTKQSFHGGYRLISVKDKNPQSKYGATPPRPSLSKAQKNKLYHIFHNLRTSLYENVDAPEITKIFSNPDGQRHELYGLNNVSHFKTDYVQHDEGGYLGDAEDVFKEVAKVICKSDSPENWRVRRTFIPNIRRTFGDDLTDFGNVVEAFEWTHNGIKYEVLSDFYDYWYFQGSFY